MIFDLSSHNMMSHSYHSLSMPVPFQLIVSNGWSWKTYDVFMQYYMTALHLDQPTVELVRNVLQYN